MSTIAGKYLLYAIIAFHFLIIVINIFSFFTLPFATPWYVAVPIMVYIANAVGTSVPCALTGLENRLRRRLGMPPIRYFIKHYLGGSAANVT